MNEHAAGQFGCTETLPYVRADVAMEVNYQLPITNY